MQVAFRANLLSAFIPAERRIGYDRSRSKDLHGLFINERIPDRPGIHVLDAIGSFCEPLGLRQTEVAGISCRPPPSSGPPRSGDDGRPVLMIALLQPRAAQLVCGPLCSGGQPRRTARLAVVLCGGRSELERHMADAIQAQLQTPALDLVGKDTLKQLLARANLVMTPDSGPMHRQRDGRQSGPACSQQSDRRPVLTAATVDRYDDAARKYLAKQATDLKWGTKIEFDDVMELITVKTVSLRSNATSPTTWGDRQPARVYVRCA